jgi:hypothetical protein
MPDIKYSTTLRNAQMDMVLAILKSLTVTNSAMTGSATAPVLRIRSGTVPANCAAADTGLALAQINLTTTSLDAAASGAVSKSGSWVSTSAINTGTATYFRIYDSSGNCHVQGTVSTNAGTGDMKLGASVTINTGQIVTISTFTLTAGNA